MPAPSNFSFFDKAKEVHKNKYDYSLVEYINSHTPVKILCPTHGIFEQLPCNHLKGSGCQKCGRKKANKTHSRTTEWFISESQKVQGSKFNYSKVKYQTSKHKVEIICNICSHQFSVLPYNHLKGQQCPRCKESLGEKKICVWLDTNDIHYVRQKTFEECRNKRKLPFDFFLPEYNLLIEFDGEQHFIERPFFGGKAALVATKNRDKIKNKYAEDHGIDLLRIRYDEDVESVLHRALG